MWIFNKNKKVYLTLNGNSLNDQKGVTFLGAVLIIFTLSTLGIGVARFSATNQTVRTHQLTSEESFYATQAGIEFSQRKILDEIVNVSDIAGIYEIGNSTFTISDGGAGTVVVTGDREGASSPYSVMISRTGANCTDLDSSAAYYASADKKMYDLYLENRCSDPVVIDKMTISWVPLTPFAEMSKIRIDADWKYSNPPLSSGIEADILDTTLPGTSTTILDYVQWKDPMDGKVVILIFTFTDGSQKSVSFPL